MVVSRIWAVFLCEVVAGSMNEVQIHDISRLGRVNVAVSSSPVQKQIISAQHMYSHANPDLGWCINRSL